jgi:hypothetical protein
LNLSRTILTGGLGRVGSSIFDDVLCRNNNLKNYHEIVLDPTETPEDRTSWLPPGGRAGSLELLSTINDWCLTIWIEDQFDSPHLEEFARLSPTLIINMYRENMFEQFVSWRLAEKNLMWNDVKKFEYQPIEISQDEVDYFLRSKQKAKYIINELRNQHRVIDISYEQIVAHHVPKSLNITDWTFKLAKQTTLEEKRSLVTNYNELEKMWINSVPNYDI